MSIRGVYQLMRLDLKYCDHSGSIFVDSLFSRAAATKHCHLATSHGQYFRSVQIELFKNNRG